MERALPARPRCAAHPTRVADGRCPTCARPRCARCASAPDASCVLCRAAVGTGAVGAVGSPLSDERVLSATQSRRLRRVEACASLAAAGLLCTAIALAGAAVGQEYVGAQYFSVVFPGLVGVACGAGAARGAARGAGPGVPSLIWWLRLEAGGYAAVSALLSFRFTDLPYGPVGRWLPAVFVGAFLAALAVGGATGRSRPPRAGHGATET